MALLPPTIKGSIFTNSTQICVECPLQGSNIDIQIVRIEPPAMVGGTIVETEVARGDADSFRKNLSIIPTLSENDELKARYIETIGGMDEPDDLSARSVIVQPAQTIILGKVTFFTKLRQGVQCIRINGALPGATIEIHQSLMPSGMMPLGTGESDCDGIVDIELSRDINAGATLLAKQIMDVDPEDTISPIIEELTVSKLSPPRVVGPIYACTQAQKVTVEGLDPGSRVTLIHKHSDGTTDPPILGYSPLNKFSFDIPSTAVDDEFTARQEFSDPSTASDPSIPQEVLLRPEDPPTPPPTPQPRVPKPRIITPLYECASEITIDNLVAGAEIRIDFGMTTALEGIAPKDGRYSFSLPAGFLTSGAEVTVQQTVCEQSITSDPSVTVESSPATLPDPMIVGTIDPRDPASGNVIVFANALVVRVENVTPGTKVSIKSSILSGGIIGEVLAFTEEVDVTPISPTLQAKDIIWAEISCGEITSPHSVEVEVVEANVVLSSSSLPTPRIVRAYRYIPFVRVSDILPGAIVDIYINDIWAGSNVSGTNEIDVPINLGYRNLSEPRLTVRAKQRLGRLESDYSAYFPLIKLRTNWQTEDRPIAAISLHNGNWLLGGRWGLNPDWKNQGVTWLMCQLNYRHGKDYERFMLILPAGRIRGSLKGKSWPSAQWDVLDSSGISTESGSVREDLKIHLTPWLAARPRVQILIYIGFLVDRYDVREFSSEYHAPDISDPEDLEIVRQNTEGWLDLTPDPCNPQIGFGFDHSGSGSPGAMVTEPRSTRFIRLAEYFFDRGIFVTGEAIPPEAIPTQPYSYLAPWFALIETHQIRNIEPVRVLGGMTPRDDRDRTHLGFAVRNIVCRVNIGCAGTRIDVEDSSGNTIKVCAAKDASEAAVKPGPANLFMCQSSEQEVCEAIREAHNDGFVLIVYGTKYLNIAMKIYKNEVVDCSEEIESEVFECTENE